MKLLNSSNAKSLSMLRYLEDEFRIYPPYWVYRVRSAQKAGNPQEAAKCFEEFSNVWRPVLRNDPFMLEAAKYNVQTGQIICLRESHISFLARKKRALSVWN
ncbi:MAG: hypothetical protein IJR85_06185 [Synergistaceae bacterium]|nr:hypothetical protein [Synergistaceae bacterium]